MVLDTANGVVKGEGGCSPHQLTSRRISHRSDMVGEVGESQIVVNVPVTSVPGCDGSNAKTFGLQHSFLIWERAADLQTGHA